MTTAARRDAHPSVPRADDALLDAWERHLSTRPEHTRAAYARDARALKGRTGARCAARVAGAAQQAFAAGKRGGVHQPVGTSSRAAGNPAASGDMVDEAGAPAARASTHAASLVRLAHVAVLGRLARGAGAS